MRWTQMDWWYLGLAICAGMIMTLGQRAMEERDDLQEDLVMADNERRQLTRDLQAARAERAEPRPE